MKNIISAYQEIVGSARQKYACRILVTLIYCSHTQLIFQQLPSRINPESAEFEVFILISISIVMMSQAMFTIVARGGQW